jgi:hypothetical protein
MIKYQGCQNGRLMVKITVRTSISSGHPYRSDIRIQHPDVHTRPQLPRGCSFTRPRERVNAFAWTSPVRANLARRRGRLNASERTGLCIRANANTGRENNGPRGRGKASARTLIWGMSRRREGIV